MLVLLVERAGEIVPREDLRRAIWPAGTFVDFDRGLNFCVNRIRRTLGEDARAREEFESLRALKPPPEIERLIASKGSITVAGVSLTVNEVDEQGFGVLIIPHTWSVTTLSKLQAGDRVNLEADMMARYAARLVEARSNR